MQRHTLFAAAAVILASAVIPAIASDGIPDKPYSQWSQQEIQQAAQTLGPLCQNKCLPLANAGQRGAFEAAACVDICFVDHLPSDYPNIAAFEHMAWENSDKAHKMGSVTPYPGFARQ